MMAVDSGGGGSPGPPLPVLAATAERDKLQEALMKHEEVMKEKIHSAKVLWHSIRKQHGKIKKRGIQLPHKNDVATVRKR